MKNIFQNKVSKKLLWLILIFFFILILGYTLLQYISINNQTPATDKTGSRKIKNPIRVPLFTDPQNVRHNTRFNFTFDPPKVLLQYRQTEKLDKVISKCRTDFQIAIKLMGWARSQWQPGRPDPYPPINATVILNMIRQGKTKGFCAQYNYVFVQGLQSFAIKARYVTVINHEVTEVWIPEHKKWICFDPLNNCYYLDHLGEPLSVYGIWKNTLEEKNVTLSGDHNIPDLKAHLAKFRAFAVWLKNDHVSSPINFSDIDYYKVYYIDDLKHADKVPYPSLFTTSVKDIYYDPFN